MAIPIDPARQAAVERDLRLVDAAIALVRRGVATRVTVVNLPNVAVVLEAARTRARLGDVSLTLAVPRDGGFCALVVAAGPSTADTPTPARRRRDGEVARPARAPQLRGASRTR